MRNTVWKFKEKITNDLAYKISKELGIDPYLVKLIYTRGMKSKDEIKKFLSSELKDISNPFELVDVNRAISRIEKAIKYNEKIFIYGDYDVDGICATSLFILAFKQIGIKVDYYIPNRNDGYGINKKSLQELKELGCNLIITVDCGITSFEEIDLANSLNIDVIVTDHHNISYIPPKAFAVINPQRVDNLYKFKYLAGVGTAFMVIYALYKSLGEELDKIFQFLDLVAIGTVADVMPLTDENRIFVKHGLKRLKNSSILGLNLLIKNLIKSEENITTTHIGFKIAPIFNAAGRLESANTVVNFLICDEEKECEKLYNYLFNLNKERQNLGKEILEKVEEEISYKNLNKNKIIICASKDYHQGLIGIVSTRIANKYKKPTIILNIKENGTALGSARSFNNIDIVEALEKSKDLLIKFGGHKQASGLTIREENIEELNRVMSSYIENLNSQEDNIIEIDESIEEFKVSLEFFDDFKSLLPFGRGNEEPIFLLKNVKFEEIRSIGKAEDHLMFNMITDNLKLKNCVWFNSKDYYVYLNEYSYYDVAIRIAENIFKGRRYTKVYIEDVKLSKETRSEHSVHSYYKDLYNVSFPIRTDFYVSECSLKKGDDIYIDKEIYSDFVPLRFKNKVVGLLKSEVSYVLRKLSKNFYFRFKAKVEDIKKIEHTYEVKININRCYDIRDQSIENRKELVNEIKDIIIGDNEYNSIQKKVLRKIIFEDRDILLISKKGRGIKTLALSIAMYYYALNGKKSLYVTYNLEIPEIFKQYFDIKYQNSNIVYENYNFAFFDEVEKIVCPIKNLCFTENISSDENREIIIDEIDLPSNLTIVNEEKEGIYTKELSITNKEIFIKNLKDGKEVESSKDIMALL